MKRYRMRCLITAVAVQGMMTLPSQAIAGAFQLLEQDGASPGNYHAGYAASAEDASIAFYNPAGLTRIKNNQFVLAALGVSTHFRYEGTVAVNTLLLNVPQPATAEGGGFTMIPAFHFGAPITDQIGFGLSIVVPFGLKTNYGYSSFLRYAATMTSVTVVDMSPALGFQLDDKTSLGIGLDIQRMFAEFDVTGGSSTPGAGPIGLDTVASNKLNDTAYGYHLGALYQFDSATRAGISYHSQVMHHLSGSSKFEGPLAVSTVGGTFTSRPTTRITLPAYTALSLYHQYGPQWVLMGSVIYTQWNVFKTCILNDTSGLAVGSVPSQNIQLVVPQHFRNAWNISIGSEYKATDRFTFRGGVGYDQTPVRNAYRNVGLPDNNRYVVALGGHYQAMKKLGFDLSWLHLFVKQTPIAPPPQAIGGQIVTTIGHVNGGADVYAAQVTWDL